MTRYDDMLLWSAIVLDMVGPVVLLLLLRRWTRQWLVAFASTAGVAPFAAFFITGGVAWISTYLRVVVRGDTSVPDAIGQAVPQYLRMTFVVCGGYGVLFAATGFGLSLPLVGLWRLAHPSSFWWFTRSGREGED